MKGIGDRFQQETKYHRHKIYSYSCNWITQQGLYKTYSNCRRISLFPPRLTAMDLNYAIKNRKSIRSFSDQPITLEHLSYLLWASTGIQRRDHDHEFRTAPSAGALYPIETYLIINNVENLSNGIYHYNIKDHLLEELKKGDYRHEISKAALDQQMCNDAAVVLIWTAIFDRSKCKYGQRAYRYIYLDAGHIAENLALASTGLKLGCCHIAALFDDEVNKIIDVDGLEESTIYMSVIGKP